MIVAFNQGLKLGRHTEGQNVASEYRWAVNRVDWLPALTGPDSTRGKDEQRY